MTRYAYSAEISTAALTTLGADNNTKASGTLGVDIRQRVARGPDGGWGMLPGAASHDRQILICVEGGSTERLAAQTEGISYQLTLVVVTHEHTLLDCAVRNAYIRDAAVDAILGNHGSSIWLATSGKQVLMSGVQHGEPGAYQDNPLTQVSESTVTVTVIH